MDEFAVEPESKVNGRHICPKGKTIITLHLKDHQLSLKSVQHADEYTPRPYHKLCNTYRAEKELTADVDSHIIGYWIDVYNLDGETIYRQFLNQSIPLNIAVVCTSWSGLRKRRALYDIALRDIPDAISFAIYEQRVTPESPKHPIRKQHIYAGFNQTSLTCCG